MGKSLLEKQQSKGARATRTYSSVAAVAGGFSHRQDFPHLKPLKYLLAFKLHIETQSKAKGSFRCAVIRSGIRRTVVQLYDGSKTQNGHNFGHEHATDLYFTFLEMAKKVFLVKFFWHRRDSNHDPFW